MGFIRPISFFLFFIYSSATVTTAQIMRQPIKWWPDGKGYYLIEGGDLASYTLPDRVRTVVVDKSYLTPPGAESSLYPRSYAFSTDETKLLLFTNTQRVWRKDTRGDYWVYDRNSHLLKQLGAGRPAASLMFAKFSPDGRQVAYVSEYNLYVEDLETGKITALTSDGNRKFIYGTFDWAYEEEFFCRDGFRWSPDSRQIAFWQIDARDTKDYIMINNTDSIYPRVVPVEYPVAGEAPSPFRIGVATVATGAINWMNIPSDPFWRSYVPRMEWAANSDELIVQHLNRKQNASDLLLCDVKTGASRTIYSERDAAWIDILPLWDQDYANGGWDWLKEGQEFLWASEKDGWRHLYRISRDGKQETLVTSGAFDVMDISTIDEKKGYVYYHASPDNATQKYLYRSRLDGTGKAERITPADQPGTHRYLVGPGAHYAQHNFSNHYTRSSEEWIAVDGHRSLDGDIVSNELKKADPRSVPVEFFKITTVDGVEMDAWRVMPADFNPAKKYPVVFYVYTEPWGQNVIDQYYIGDNSLYNGDMSKDGYIYISIDNRGTPVPKGRDWRKSIYRKIGVVNIRDQAMAAREILKWPYVDTSRIAVWGWSGGGSATLNLMFQYPQIYKTGIAIAAVGNQLTYDNIYQERYMGLPQENRQDFIKGSPITYAKNLRGNLLYIHGTGDDNVHYNNSEMLVNELVRNKKIFQMMAYPNRSHGIYEGEGTAEHLSLMYTSFLKQYCKPGPR